MDLAQQEKVALDDDTTRVIKMDESDWFWVGSKLTWNRSA